MKNQFGILSSTPLEEASEQSIHSGNKSSFSLFFLHYFPYVWYFSSNLDISVLHVATTYPNYILTL